MHTLVILAAGLGSRFGGAKQFAVFGEKQLTLMEYNIIHAVNAGYSSIVFVISKPDHKMFITDISPRLPNALNIEFVFQDIDDVPTHCTVPKTRTKPLGTAHALWCARHLLKGAFTVINGDDYYGRSAFQLLSKHSKQENKHYACITYKIINTLSAFGGVNRGLCQTSANNTLTSIEECENICLKEHKITGQLSSGKSIYLAKDTLISMNCWQFTNDIFPALSVEIMTLLNSKNSDNNECYLPKVVMNQIAHNKKIVDVMTTTDTWFGLTYPNDSENVDKNIRALDKKGSFVISSQVNE